MRAGFESTNDGLSYQVTVDEPCMRLLLKTPVSNGQTLTVTSSVMPLVLFGAGTQYMSCLEVVNLSGSLWRIEFFGGTGAVAYIFGIAAPEPSSFGMQIWEDGVLQYDAADKLLRLAGIVPIPANWRSPISLPMGSANMALAPCGPGTTTYFDEVSGEDGTVFCVVVVRHSAGAVSLTDVEYSQIPSQNYTAYEGVPEYLIVADVSGF